MFTKPVSYMSFPRPLFEKRCVTSQESSSLLTDNEKVLFDVFDNYKSRFEVLLLPPGCDSSPSQAYPYHLCTWVERGTVKVNCEALVLLRIESKESYSRTQHNVPS